MVKTGTVSVADLNTAKAELAESKVQLLQRRETAAQMLGGDMLTKFNGELLTLGVDAAELEVRAHVIAHRLALVRDARALPDQLEEARQRHARTQSELAMLTDRMRHLEEALKAPAPKVEWHDAPSATQPATQP